MSDAMKSWMRANQAYVIVGVNLVVGLIAFAVMASTGKVVDEALKAYTPLKIHQEFKDDVKTAMRENRDENRSEHKEIISTLQNVERSVVRLHTLHETPTNR